LRLASVELDRAVEGAIGLLLLTVALSLTAVVVLRRWRARRDARTEDPGVPALARFADIETSDPGAFGGGAPAARVRRRKDTVTYGYLAVAEEHADPHSDAAWCTLTVSLPGRVPFLVLDHWQAIGQPNVPQHAPLRPRLKDAAFDSAYVIGVDDPETPARVLIPAARQVLLAEPVQRLSLRGSTMLVRTFDGTRLDDAQTAAMNAFAARFLAATPSFVRTSLAASGPLRRDDPLPEGLYGPDDA
jgi:hypothetical protein